MHLTERAAGRVRELIANAAHPIAGVRVGHQERRLCGHGVHARSRSRRRTARTIWSASTA